MEGLELVYAAQDGYSYITKASDDLKTVTDQGLMSIPKVLGTKLEMNNSSLISTSFHMG